MAAITPQNTESNLVGNLTNSVDTVTTTIKATFADRISGSQRTPQSTTKLFVIDKGTELFPNSNYEIVLVGSHSTAANGVTTMINCVRGLAYFGSSLAAGTGQPHQGQAEIGCVDVHYLWTILNSILDGTNSPPGFKIGTPIIFELAGIIADRVFADATARDLAIPSPTNGMSCYNTALGVAQDYIAGAWVNRAAGATVNATTAAAGKVRIETQATFDAGTAMVGGDPAVPQADIIQAGIQKGSSTYATTAGGTLAYTLTLTPALTAYTTGQRFYVKWNATNTGTSTLAVNGLAVLTIKKNFNQDVIAGDLISGAEVQLMYDGTNLQIVGNAAPYAFLTTKGDFIGISASNTPVRVPVGANTQIPIADSTQTVGWKWGATPITTANFKPLTVLRAGNAASGTQTIAHGFGKIPSFIEIDTKVGFNVPTPTISWSNGSYDGTNNVCTTMTGVLSGGGNGSDGNDNTTCINITGQSATATFDATNIYLAWNNPVPTYTVNIALFIKVWG